MRRILPLLLILCVSLVAGSARGAQPPAIDDLIKQLRKAASPDTGVTRDEERIAKKLLTSAHPQSRISCRS